MADRALPDAPQDLRIDRLHLQLEHQTRKSLSATTNSSPQSSQHPREDDLAQEHLQLPGRDRSPSTFTQLHSRSSSWSPAQTSQRGQLLRRSSSPSLLVSNLAEFDKDTVSFGEWRKNLVLQLENHLKHADEQTKLHYILNRTKGEPFKCLKLRIAQDETNNASAASNAPALTTATECLRQLDKWYGNRHSKSPALSDISTLYQHHNESFSDFFARCQDRRPSMTDGDEDFQIHYLLSHLNIRYSNYLNDGTIYDSTHRLVRRGRELDDSAVIRDSANDNDRPPPPVDDMQAAQLSVAAHSAPTSQSSNLAQGSLHGLWNTSAWRNAPEESAWDGATLERLQALADHHAVTYTAPEEQVSDGVPWLFTESREPVSASWSWASIPAIVAQRFKESRSAPTEH